MLHTSKTEEPSGKVALEVVRCQRYTKFVCKMPIEIREQTNIHESINSNRVGIYDKQFCIDIVRSGIVEFYRAAILIFVEKGEATRRLDKLLQERARKNESEVWQHEYFKKAV